ncbi:gamma carbonic anhydrase family protein [Streptomyces hoynatensis]|uniref:Gamma carbonic anhydrase family protein n=1 Tax=Streptomyces hoynatensis TaxID=1141874 RepID=A0A3A9ZF19_9ACTN|nr:gamma carbonic anhydrase family protein [Streptomyces hoynatensis]RKN46940.1 gamma carbonic anhydrase family protein [Streptomyces hoynatensis]
MSLIPFEDRAPRLAEGAWVAPGATVLGDVRLGAGASVWYGTVVRADLERIEIGAGSNVQDGCVLHADPGFPAVLGAGVSVGHRAVVHGCLVEEDSLVGMGAVLLNGARVGRGSLIAAGAVLLEGTSVPPGSLVAGVPGKVRRALTAAEREGLRATAARYRDLARRHAAHPAPPPG